MDIHCTAVNVMDDTVYTCLYTYCITDGTVTLAFIHILCYALQYIKIGHVCSQGVNVGREQVRAGGTPFTEELLSSMRRTIAMTLSEVKVCVCVCSCILG